MIRESAIQEQLAKYLGDEQSFEGLEDWLVENARIQYLENSQPVREILGKLRFLMFQCIEGEIDETRLRLDLHKLIERQETEITLGAAVGVSQRLGSGSGQTLNWPYLFCIQS